MTNMGQFLSLLASLPDACVYLLLAVSAFVENIFPPIPGDTITAFGAFLVGTDKLSFLGVYLSTTFGSFLGFMALFHIGSYLGRRFFLEKDYRLFKAKDILRAESWFQRWGYPLVGFNRFLPGVRSVISISAGISRLRSFSVSLLAFVSCSIWNLIWIALGYELGANWETVSARLSDILAEYNLIVFSGLVLAVLTILANRAVKSRRAGRGKAPRR